MQEAVPTGLEFERGSHHCMDSHRLGGLCDHRAGARVAFFGIPCKLQLTQLVGKRLPQPGVTTSYKPGVKQQHGKSLKQKQSQIWMDSGGRAIILPRSAWGCAFTTTKSAFKNPGELSFQHCCVSCPIYTPWCYQCRLGDTRERFLAGRGELQVKLCRRSFNGSR